mmetsp:Transcript_4622/g.11870  ORF Transcript_4622/g.11870 Transcript_4622/m.11870 type:complete len:597 (-) Transcript_4622:1561-3351(-)|eukprot:CAMPEP_0197187676 /NCGR_PEP_ID=MMETSP1423-20130617/16322_1 /TAXON_ID=476441 /ORGANISM="Pseudo-nitzschia heimii, Strain UNC1101" /LENGTH=596 /DNA_ID=CAMNT_0042639319 /DNA_START=215 /DNA_END=2005 /DNA_ORIENTATION=+
MSKPKFATFDDASSTMSNREDFLLVLVSSLFGTTTQARNQKRALTMIEACGVQPEVLDAADPANTLVRDELCDISGIRGIYPQFFLVQGDRTSFFADFEEMEHMNEEGTLAEWLSMELPITKLSPENNQVNDEDGCTNAPSTDYHRRRSKSHLSHDDANGNVFECDYEYDRSSSTDDLLNVASVTKILNSIDSNNSDLEEQLQDQVYSIKRDGKQNITLPIPTPSLQQDEWSNPLLHDQYEDEILALEEFLDDERGLTQQQQGIGEKLVELKAEREIESERLLDEITLDDLVSGALVHTTLNQKPSISYDEDNDSAMKDSEIKKNFGPYHYGNKNNSVGPLSSTVTTPTVSPTSSSSSSQSPERDVLDESSAVDSFPSPLPSPSVSSCHEIKKYSKRTSCNVSMQTISTRSENEELLRAEVEELRRKCEKLAAERYKMEGQLKEARQRNRIHQTGSSDHQNIGTIHKFQLQQNLRCAGCMKVFKSNASSLNAPIASQACGHSICRNCCHKRLSAVRHHQDKIVMNSSERLRSTISSDLFMCGMGDMSQVYSSSFEEHQHQLQECESCPICSAPKAFRQGKLHVNESLCLVLKLLDN